LTLAISQPLQEDRSFGASSLGFMAVPGVEVAGMVHSEFLLAVDYTGVFKKHGVSDVDGRYLEI